MWLVARWSQIKILFPNIAVPKTLYLQAFAQFSKSYLLVAINKKIIMKMKCENPCKIDENVDFNRVSGISIMIFRLL
nr:MAG TPA: hypothetical protein [Caudoviricetes sp.]